MRKLTQREKILVALVAGVALIVLFMRVGPGIRQGFSGGTLADKRKELQTARDLVSLSQITKRVDGKIRDSVGLQGRVISDRLFEEISNRVNVEDINRARRASDLAALHPALEGKADILLSYKKQHGEFESLNALKAIRGPIFEGEQPQAIIARRIDNLVKKARLRPNQLNIKPTPGKRSEKIPSQAKKNFVLYLYMGELAEELKQLQAQQKEIEEAARRQAEAEEEVANTIFDAWWDDESNVEETTEETEVETEEQLIKGELNASVSEKSNVKADPPATGARAVAKTDGISPSNPDLTKPMPSDRQFTLLPEVIPLPVRLQLIQFIQHNLKLQIVGAAEFRKGFIADGITTVSDNVQRGFLGLGGKMQTVQVRFKADSILLSKFESLINRHEDEQDGEIREGETGEPLDYEGQLNALATYVVQTQKQIEKLQVAFAKVPSTYQPEIYIVDMNFKGEMDKVVKLIQSIEASSKWLFVRGLKISITTDRKDKEKRKLSADLSMIAKIP